MDYGFGSDNNGWGVEDSARSKLEYDLAHGHYGSNKSSSSSAKGINRIVIIIVIISLLSQGLAGALTLLIIGAVALMIYGLVYYIRLKRSKSS